MGRDSSGGRELFEYGDIGPERGEDPGPVGIDGGLGSSYSEEYHRLIAQITEGARAWRAKHGKCRWAGYRYEYVGKSKIKVAWYTKDGAGDGVESKG